MFKKNITNALLAIATVVVLFGAFFLFGEVFLGLSVLFAGGALFALAFGINKPEFVAFTLFIIFVIFSVIFANNCSDFGLFTKYI